MATHDAPAWFTVEPEHEAKIVVITRAPGLNERTKQLIDLGMRLALRRVLPNGSLINLQFVTVLEVWEEADGDR